MPRHLLKDFNAASEPAPLIRVPSTHAHDHTHSLRGGSARTLVVVFSSLGWNGVVRAEWSATLRGVPMPHTVGSPRLPPRATAAFSGAARWLGLAVWAHGAAGFEEPVRKRSGGQQRRWQAPDRALCER